MPVAVPSIPSLAAGATLANPKLARPLAPKEPPARDYGGYTDLNIPTVTWPGDKKVALNISIHFEEGAEATPENGDEYSEVLMGETDRRPQRKGRDFPLESVYEFGSKRGVWRLYQLLEELGFTFSLIACGRSAELAPVVVTEAVNLGAEIVASGYRYTNYDLVPEDVEAAHISGTLEILKALSPSNDYPKGYYIERPSISSSVLIAQAYEKTGCKLGYDSSVYGDDLPYYAADGTLLIPHTLDCNDHKFVDAPGFSSPDDFLEHLNNALDVLLAEGRKGKPKMMTLALHPHIIGRPGRFVALKQFLQRIKAESDDVWVCQKQDIAKYWVENHPAA